MQYAYRNSLVNLSFVRSCTEVVIAYYSVAYGFRFIGRLSNPEYRNFSRELIRQNSEPKKSDTDALLTKYDYEVLFGIILHIEAISCNFDFFFKGSYLNDVKELVILKFLPKLNSEGNCGESF